MMRPGAVLAALAELAPARAPAGLDVTTGGSALLWLDSLDHAPRGRAVDKLAALDALHSGERILRLGVGFVIGALDPADATTTRRRKVRLPLASIPVRLDRDRRGYRIIRAGDIEVTDLVEDPARAAEFEAAPGLGDAGWPDSGAAWEWVRAVAKEAGLPVGKIEAKPPVKPPDDRIIGITGGALFVAREVVRAGVGGTLRDWADKPGLDATAFAAVYGSGVAASTVDDAEVRSPLPLNGSQREVVRLARTAPVTVVSGPPGTGKSHAVVAAALDVVAAGGSVLVATQSGQAAAVLTDLLARYPGPVPVAFGDSERREALATELAGGIAAETDERALRSASAAVEAADARVRALVAAASTDLDLEVRRAESLQWQPLVPALSTVAPGFFVPGADLAAARRAAAIAGDPEASSRWPWSPRRRAARRLRRIADAGGTIEVGDVVGRGSASDSRGAMEPGDVKGRGGNDLATALRAAECVAADARLATIGGTDLGPTWSALVAADADRAAAVGEAMRLSSRSKRRWTKESRRAAAALAGALRAGRNRRRTLLAGLDGAALISALPLWIGTVTDVEDLLPAVPGLFDLVILDEASHVDQIRAAPVLLRAKRALIVGDPCQLRFVSFAADVDVAAALARHGLDDRVDVRRVSAFDLATGAAPVTWLAQHYRSAPHLIEFSASRFYRDRMTVATRHPANDSADLIDIVRVSDGRISDGVNRAEVDAVLATVEKLRTDGVRGIGVLTPFRAQADALEAALLAAFTVEEIRQSGLRVGTVHAFQGSESDVVVASLALVDGGSPSRTRFVAEPSLFNVMVTRGRSRMIVISGLSEPAGIIGDYLAHGARPAGPPPPDRPATGWAASLAAELSRAGAAVRERYPVGPWIVDIVVTLPTGVRGLICAVHPDGPAAHIDRQRELIRAGWDLTDAFASRWADDPVRAALDLVHRR